MNANAAATGQPAPDRRLLDLQALDLSIDRLRIRRESLEVGEDVRRARTAAADLEARLGELGLSIDDVAREQRRLENDVDSMRRKRDAERKRLLDGSVVNARELQSIEAEVTNLDRRIDSKEDQLLELMERREELEERRGPMEAELREARDRLAEIEGSSGRELVEVESAMASRIAEREELAATLDTGLLGLYEELRRTKKGVGAVALVDGICQGCHQKLSPVYLEQLKRSQGVRRCEYCRRILVYG